MNKQVTLIVPGGNEGEQDRVVTIKPGITVSQFLTQQNLNNYLLSNGPHSSFFQGADELYKLVQDGD